MHFFVICNWIGTLVTACLLLYIGLYRKHLLVKPSVWFVIFFHLQVQWASTVFSGENYSELGNPIHFLMLTQFPPVTILIATLFFLNRTALTVWKKVKADAPYTAKISAAEFACLCALWAMIMFLYFLNVPLDRTGLLVSFTSSDTREAIWAREDSLKLVNLWIRYLYIYNSGFLAILLGSICSFRAVANLRRSFLLTLLYAGLFVLFSLSAMLSGARGEGAVLLLGVIMCFWFRAGCPLRLRYVLLTFLLILTVPTIIDLARQRVDFKLEGIIESRDTILARIFVVPMDVGLLWVQYVEDFGYWGIAGVSKLALLCGIEPINVQNFMSRVAFPMSEFNQTALMNTGFVFSYYCYFGLAAVPFLPPAILALDYVLLLVQRLRRRYTVIAIAMLALSVHCLPEADYTTLFVSFGFATSIMTFLLLGSFDRMPRERRAARSRFLRGSVLSPSGQSQSLSH
jgi:hypothetical protein